MKNDRKHVKFLENHDKWTKSHGVARKNTKSGLVHVPKELSNSIKSLKIVEITRNPSEKRGSHENTLKKLVNIDEIVLSFEKSLNNLKRWA